MAEGGGGEEGGAEKGGDHLYPPGLRPPPASLHGVIVCLLYKKKTPVGYRGRRN